MRLLLVEDDQMIGESVRVGLQQDGFAVDWVQDGRAAELALETNSYDTLLLDLGLPRKAGLDVLASLRRRGDAIPVLMLTARDAIADRVKGLDSGADDYLVKPFALEELLARVRALSRRNRPPGADGDGNTLRVGDLQLNLRTREAERDSRKIDLTAREFALLELMMRHPGQVFTRSQLLDRAWSYEITAESNVVDIYIHYLRNKIDRESDEKLIKTVRGVGYAIRSG